MIRFGTGGWRAVIGEEYTKENLEKLSLALAYMIRDAHLEETPVVIGYDRRFLSKESAIWASAVLASESVRICPLRFPVSPLRELCISHPSGRS